MHIDMTKKSFLINLAIIIALAFGAGYIFNPLSKQLYNSFVGMNTK